MKFFITLPQPQTPRLQGARWLRWRWGALGGVGPGWQGPEGGRPGSGKEQQPIHQYELQPQEALLGFLGLPATLGPSCSSTGSTAAWLLAQASASCQDWWPKGKNEEHTALFIKTCQHILVLENLCKRTCAKKDSQESSCDLRSQRQSSLSCFGCIPFRSFF